MNTVKKTKSKDGVEIVYEVTGNGSPALVFVHCWCGNRSYWNKQIEYFSRRFTCIAIDLAGHGESGTNRIRWTIPAFAEDVLSVIANENPKKIILIGHSMGGFIVLAASLKLKDRLLAIVGADSFANIEFEISEEDLNLFMKPYERNFRETVMEYITALFPPESDKKLVERITNDMCSAPADIAVESFRESFHFNQPEVFDMLDLPVICINADRHPTDAEGLKHHIKNLDLIIVEKSGHFFILENPEKFNSILEESLSKKVKGFTGRRFSMRNIFK